MGKFFINKFTHGFYSILLKKYLESVGLQEVNSKFIELSRDTNIDWTKIKEKIAEDKKLEGSIKTE